jgi:hypothetical protein
LSYLLDIGGVMIVYSFEQNNSGGYYRKPAKHIIVKDACNEKHAEEIAIKAGMYYDGKAAGTDCSCCGDRWYPMDYEHETIEDAIAHASGRRTGGSPSTVPQYIVVGPED